VQKLLQRLRVFFDRRLMGVALNDDGFVEQKPAALRVIPPNAAALRKCRRAAKTLA
jgi:hypothetical protein